ncbi:MAG: oxidoreductase protein [uncultured bacterium]|uniref:Oxidoreductase domain-containing protein n=1 Tax=Candidatus Daviesbacteria bacterium GW2011_GWC2_40_12 TaxID=1618431 RepID=A0A0G0QQF7_9BACT|nr:MAG: oxidoreductase protein [uncultured bacterium]KKR17255.1 MAG: Oxidoreductase domain-containing protein [Candidatus Daviesbacteria bacterium GW2011_GWA2_39_33]KKR42654.1 MAG: Oxidoreductase domain-containing protein [Candidatus Daviesbacteria bacterium GW2011_GWC2_40_12]OGE21329.1 MAG: hypothetical protein A2778_04135 [Candidatus Daviesbacteria bacterium RIFCSPHIGHO2_01_FULL_40_24]OGE30153.1 MAG: hypothetical protein A3C29_01985 [Candidatus Daviesbacteria bacterium RIFCSPHIGHO2_02_FULL_40
MKRICIIGAGNIGSRHLQGLKKITSPLSITVFDPSAESLSTARQRYDQIPSSLNHEINFLQTMEDLPKNIDLAIIATSSNVRRKVTEELLKNSTVKYLILEKILFQKAQDYKAIKKQIKKKKIKAWVNFSMRIMPFYQKIKEQLRSKKIHLIVSGSQWGLVTNAVHFIDFIAFLTDCYDFTIDTKGLNSKPIESKRPGFLELIGTLNIHFKNGSFGSLTCYPSGDSPYIIEVLSETYRCISKESEKKAWISQSKNGWKWTETETNLPFQSGLTNIVAEKIFKNGTCGLASYDEASKIHLTLLNQLHKFLNKSAAKKFTLYPFT